MEDFVNRRFDTGVISDAVVATVTDFERRNSLRLPAVVARRRRCLVELFLFRSSSDLEGDVRLAGRFSRSKCGSSPL